MVEADGCGNSLQGDENVLGLGLQLLECLPSMPEGPRGPGFNPQPSVGHPCCQRSGGGGGRI